MSKHNTESTQAVWVRLRRHGSRWPLPGLHAVSPWVCEPVPACLRACEPACLYHRGQRRQQPGQAAKEPIAAGLPKIAYQRASRARATASGDSRARC